MPKILIVEDEADMARGLQFNLEARGFDVVIARDGEEGYRAAIAERPDLVLLDVMLPKRDGYEVCRALRKVQPGLPILMPAACRGTGHCPAPDVTTRAVRSVMVAPSHEGLGARLASETCPASSIAPGVFHSSGTAAPPRSSSRRCSRS